MPSPFPGMDPYLEAYWGDVHTSLMTYGRDQLRCQLPRDLRVRVEEHVTVQMADQDTIRQGGYDPDVRVMETPGGELKEPAARLLCVGALALLGTQACVNMAMTMGLLPITGVPLPFVSYGGSSMLASWLLLALVLNARARRPLVFSVGDFD